MLVPLRMQQGFRPSHGAGGLWLVVFGAPLGLGVRRGGAWYRYAGSLGDTLQPWHHQRLPGLGHHITSSGHHVPQKLPDGLGPAESAVEFGHAALGSPRCLLQKSWQLPDLSPQLHQGIPQVLRQHPTHDQRLPWHHRGGPAPFGRPCLGAGRSRGWAGISLCLVPAQPRLLAVVLRALLHGFQLREEWHRGYWGGGPGVGDPPSKPQNCEPAALTTSRMCRSLASQ